MNIIETHNLSVSLGGKQILHSLTLRVPPGTICALLGPNGAGKTTLIKTLMNIHTPKAGEASIFGVASTRLGPAELQRIGYISENQKLPDYMRVGEFLTFCAALYPNWDSAWCDKMVAQLELPLKQRLSELSRGMKIKTCLVSSLAYHPELLILDEPFSGLDPIVRDDFLDQIIELASQAQATTLISSHDLHEVERIADSIAFLNHGRVIDHQELDTLVSRYRQVTVEIASQHAISNLPARWLQPRFKDNLVKFVDPDFKQEVVIDELNALGTQYKFHGAQAITLKEIYRAMVALN